MAIQIKDVRKAMKMIGNPREYLFCKALHKQLVMSLEIYEARGEYDGTLPNAIACLEMAGYEINNAVNDDLSDEKNSPSEDMDNE